ncbi:RNA-binding protein 45 [Sceloporus undulatus]|uniref:RNA-binding protein 45 n=1 Tax=Sceloporus undulatus TaxID=8520 RepID=UPI001C4ADF72|nr:RNA-binding protein 45 [Sceloporus undulatus]XP_042301738.1 RNA-binding protein 45 [Sceloporus undulatus]XP_042301739.1 RNA-binding protein 45 [Sceloporus undulatus]
MSASEQLPDLSSFETSDTRSQECVSRRLSVVSEFPFVQQQLFRLFDIIPGLEACETYQGLYSKRVYAMIQYSNVASAIYAKNRLNGFEYPFGNHLLVTFIEDETDEIDLIHEMATDLVNSELSSAILKDDSVLQLLGSSESQFPSPSLQTDAALPSCKRKAPRDSSVRERLFILFHPYPLPQDVLDNVLSRFGSFINAYIIPGENMAFAMFAERASASDAIAVLHGKTVNGVKLKVKLADLPIENSNKS